MGTLWRLLPVKRCRSCCEDRPVDYLDAYGHRCAACGYWTDYLEDTP